MTPESFTFWLHGFDEISGGVVPNATQWAIIQDHLKLVISPTRNPSGGYPAPTPPLSDVKYEDLRYC